MQTIRTIEELESRYGKPKETSVAKEVARITKEYAAIIAASPFAALATCGPEGLDCSPRGDLAGFVRVHDETTLMMPDRRGNNRLDSLRNIVRDPRVALLFLLPGIGLTLRVNGRARLRCDAELLATFAVEDSLMRPAEERLAPHLHDTAFAAARAPIYVNVDAAKVTDGAAARDALIRQVSRPVRWLESVEQMRKDGVTLCVEVGQGKVLTGLIKRIDKSIQLVNVQGPADFDAARAAIEKARAEG